MDKTTFLYQCLFVDKFSWFREAFISFNSGVLGSPENGATKPLPNPGPERKVFLEGVSKGSSDGIIAAAIRKAAESATDFSWLSKGDRVLIKPACNSGEKYPCTTSPIGIKAMAELLREKGAKKVVVSDMAGIEHVRLTPDTLCSSTRKMMHGNGILAAAEAGGAEMYFPEERGWDGFFEDGPVSGSHWKNGIMMPKILNEVDHIVLMPRVSRHPLAGATLGIKCAVGYIRFDSRLEYHRDAHSYYEKHTEINSVPSLQNKLRLVLTTATKVQSTFGPDQGYPMEPDTGLIIASDSLVAHDMAAHAWLLEARDLTPPEQKRGIKDPYSTNTKVISILNAGLVFLLGGVKESARSQRLQKYDVESVWNDPTLNRAFEIWGGAPKVELKTENQTVPDTIMKSLAERIIL